MWCSRQLAPCLTWVNFSPSLIFFSETPGVPLQIDDVYRISCLVSIPLVTGMCYTWLSWYDVSPKYTGWVIVMFIVLVMNSGMSLFSLFIVNFFRPNWNLLFILSVLFTWFISFICFLVIILFYVCFRGFRFCSVL